MRFEIEGSEDESRRRQLDARDDDPRVSVSTVAEYVYCARAGLLSHERRSKDRGEEERTYDALPRYEREAIEQAFTRRFKLWFVSLVVFLTVSFVAVWTTPDQGAWRIVAIVIAAMALLALAYRIVGLTQELVVLLWRRHSAFSGVEREFNLDDGEIQPVVWWDFYASGFQSQQLEPMLDEKWKLEGKPWRVLIKGSEYIPVFKARKAHETPKPQHIARIMAYCHLMLATQDRVSPFGVILYGKSYEGVAVPNDERYRNRFHAALLAVRKMVRESKAKPPDIPDQTAKCSACPLGYPRRIEKLQPTMQDGAALDPKILWSNHGKRFHCDCGDRFGWRPPHQRSEELDLRMEDT